MYRALEDRTLKLEAEHAFTRPLAIPLLGFCNATARQGMNTGAGMVKFDSPVQVATVVADTEVHESGVHVQPYYGQPKYQVC